MIFSKYNLFQKETNVYEEYNKWEDSNLIDRYLRKEGKSREDLRREISVSCVEREINNNNKKKILELHAEKYYSSSQSNLAKEARCSALLIENENTREYKFACLPVSYQLSYVHLSKRHWNTIAEWKKKELPKINERTLETIKWGQGELTCYLKPNSIVVGLFYIEETEEWDIVAFAESAYAYCYSQRFKPNFVSKQEEIYESHKYITSLVKDSFWSTWKELGFLLPSEEKNFCFHFFYHPDLKKIEFFSCQNLSSRQTVSLQVEKYNWTRVQPMGCFQKNIPINEVIKSLIKILVNVSPLYYQGTFLIFFFFFIVIFFFFFKYFRFVCC